jgi:hypothetical protein
MKPGAGHTRFLDDGRICLTNNAADRAPRGIALGRKSWLFAGSDRGGERAAVMYTLIQTAGLARRRARPHQRSQYPEARPTAALEFEDGSDQGRRLTIDTRTIQRL